MSYEPSASSFAAREQPAAVLTPAQSDVARHYIGQSQPECSRKIFGGEPDSRRGCRPIENDVRPKIADRESVGPKEQFCEPPRKDGGGGFG